jgi:hypothetical protein
MFDKDFDQDQEFDLLDEDMDDDEGAEGEVVLQAPLGSTPVDFAQMGLAEMAYIRKTVVNNQPLWSIHSAAGHPLGAAQSFEQAWAAVKQHDLEPMRVN